ncbi:hypothetical protein PV433_30890 [Paenibacillus sp. GYB004]|uniref:hypothetical protein n=1 Tax=Paenibacillus sp. GYB004 TaxID=2994393 RepID=UPI002F96AD0C
MKGEQLRNLGYEIIQLAGYWYGSSCKPSERVGEISARTGVKAELIQAALCAAGDLHA